MKIDAVKHRVFIINGRPDMSAKRHRGNDLVKGEEHDIDMPGDVAIIELAPARHGEAEV